MSNIYSNPILAEAKVKTGGSAILSLNQASDEETDERQVPIKNQKKRHLKQRSHHVALDLIEPAYAKIYGNADYVFPSLSSIQAKALLHQEKMNLNHLARHSRPKDLPQASAERR